MGNCKQENISADIGFDKRYSSSAITGIGKPEPLKQELKGYWSRRINAEHRLVYKVSDDAVTIISCKYHYQ